MNICTEMEKNPWICISKQKKIWETPNQRSQKITGSVFFPYIRIYFCICRCIQENLISKKNMQKSDVFQKKMSKINDDFPNKYLASVPNAFSTNKKLKTNLTFVPPPKKNTTKKHKFVPNMFSFTKKNLGISFQNKRFFPSQPHHGGLAFGLLLGGDTSRLERGEVWPTGNSLVDLNGLPGYKGVSKNGGIPKMDDLWWKTLLLKWMICGYHYFWKHPYGRLYLRIHQWVTCVMLYQ